jgi:phosphocarrier protein HPr
METRKARVLDHEGLHLRKAAQVVHRAKRFKSKVTLGHRETRADASSIMQLLLLGAGPDTELEVTAHGPDEKEAVLGIVELFDQGAGI